MVAVEGYTVIPALLVGLINISEVQRDIFTGALAMKYGFSSRFEAGIRVPYLIINEDLREREVFRARPSTPSASHPVTVWAMWKCRHATRSMMAWMAGHT